MGNLAFHPGARLKVTQRSAIGGRWGRRRAGFAFGREPVEIEPSDLGEGLVAVMRLANILGDSALLAVLVDPDGNEHPIGDEELAQLNAAIDAEQANSSGEDDDTGASAGGPEGAKGTASPASPPAPESTTDKTATDTTASESKPAGEQSGSPAAKAGARGGRKPPKA